jgi:hypothetical protein
MHLDSKVPLDETTEGGRCKAPTLTLFLEA